VPATHVLLRTHELATAADRLGTDLVKAAVHRAQAHVREGELAPDAVVDAVLADLPAAATSMRRVLNATGVVVHTNLGRAPLSAAAVHALATAAGTTDVELDLLTGSRGRRGAGALAALAAAVPDAEDVHVVNNGAAALCLVATALRGEIGDGFRIPELLEASGVRLREVGTTNRVSLADYSAALGPDTSFVLKVHPSNFVVHGFTSSVRIEELAALPVPVVADIGSGLLAAHPRLPDEPDAASALRAGATLATASGDKLLGGPQCGLLLGRAELVQRLRRHPVARALRVDKLTLAALEATLRGPDPPVVAALAATFDVLLARAERVAAALRSGGLDARAVPSTGVVGGGGAPGVDLPSGAVALAPFLAGPLRIGALPVVGRVEGDRLLLDLLGLDPADDDALVAAVLAVA
jgi:L-seryl-tRNA(Ser) seleniumtransferase